MIKIPINPRGATNIGRLGENEHRCIFFRESVDVFRQYPDATVTVLHKRPGDPSAYPVNAQYIQIENGILYWTVQSGDLTRVGEGQCELIYLSGGKVAKNDIYTTSIDTALDGAGTPPDPWLGWVTQVIEASKHAPQIINGVWWAWDTTTEQYVNTEVPATGATGTGISRIDLNPDYTLTITLTDGTYYTTGSIRGAKGEDGQNGSDYVITQADYDAIAAAVAQNAGFQQIVQDANDAADDACGWATGNHRDGTVNPQHNNNNAEYFYEQIMQIFGAQWLTVQDGKLCCIYEEASA